MDSLPEACMSAEIWQGGVELDARARGGEGETAEEKLIMLHQCRLSPRKGKIAAPALLSF